MRLSLRFVIPLLLALAAFAYAAVPLVDRLTLRWFMRDLDIRATLIANTVQETLQGLARAGSQIRMEQFFARITQDERLYAMAFCPDLVSEPVSTPSFPPEFRCSQLDGYTGSTGHLLARPEGPVLVSVRSLGVDESTGSEIGRLVLVHDMSFVARRSAETRYYLFLFFVGIGASVAFITVIVAQLSWRGWTQGFQSLLRGEGLFRATDPAVLAEMRPFARDLRTLIQDLEARHRSRDVDQLVWTPESLREIMRSELSGHDVMVVSNREPYIHVRAAQGIEVRRPASGLVTAIEPIMRACSGTWIAHGGGSADRDVVDSHDRLRVPPEHPAYQLRRVWLSPEEEGGYYYGFANEGIWPLCHIAHVRPIFRASDWKHYVAVNRQFAQAVAEEAKVPDPIVLIQDYHLALLPRMIRESMPEATVVAFWHIPWPNPEGFGICPWREELLDGLLGSSILGFHTQFHCNNFVDTVDRLLEARVDRETFTVSYRGKLTAIKRYPIAIDSPPSPALVADPVERCRTVVRERHGLPPHHVVGVGVDRLDYTKGIEERLRAVERLLEREPEWIGRFTFIQIAAPTRHRIPQYQDYEQRVRAMAAQINERFKAAPCPPIVLLVEHHEPADIYRYYRGGDLCLVTSLHDGMNLVAKEFVSSRDDERGVLILSQFTGAARELPEALIVNPYDTEQCATALHRAIVMAPGEQRTRMRLMRSLVREFNVYRWGGRMLIDAAAMRRRERLLDGAKTHDRKARREPVPLAPPIR
ncbi:MAG TPA: trehalose-6-phosphate synthase [Gemmatimonadales bacterium]|nr:trehalose-6-phosphate synthase [Gemmatimonadales bacterium]